MASASFETTKNGVQMGLEGIIRRGKSVSAYLNRVLFPLYQQAQINRWQSQNSSQTGQWAELKPSYVKIKAKKFASYPGAGQAIMVATGKLAAGAQARDTALYYKLITDQSFTISVNRGAIPYAQYPGVMRPYMSFNEDTILTWKAGIRDYICKGKGVK